MNQRPTGLNVTKAITGFLQYKSAEGLSPVTDRRRKFIMQRSTSKRDKAILLTLLDTGLRAGER